MKLYELAQNYMNLQELLENPEIPEEIVTQALNNVGEELEDKAENIAKLIKTLEVDVKGFKEEEQRLADRRKSLENRVKGLKGYLEGAMILANKEKFKGKLFSFNIQNNPPSVEIINQNELPKEYWKIVEIEDKTKIKEALKSGIEVPGAVLTVSRSLRIR